MVITAKSPSQIEIPTYLTLVQVFDEGRACKLRVAVYAQQVSLNIGTSLIM